MGVWGKEEEGRRRNPHFRHFVSENRLLTLGICFSDKKWLELSKNRLKLGLKSTICAIRSFWRTSARLEKGGFMEFFSVGDTLASAPHRCNAQGLFAQNLLGGIIEGTWAFLAYPYPVI